MKERKDTTDEEFHRQV